jgi:subtilisin family serine protease
LVVVQIWDVNADEVNNALRLIYQDIGARPERRKKSVINMSLWLEPGWSDPNAENLLHDLIKRLLDMDIPMFVVAGNFATDPQRTDVDTYPALFAAPDYPLGVVGSTDHGGARSSFSQGGLQVTLHALGNQITCMLRDSNSVATDKEGTSYATAIVAGEAANLMSYNTVLFDTSDGNLAKNLRDYLQTDAAS